MADIFDANPDQGVDQNKNYLEELVGDGKKFKTPEDLARGKAEADRHIDALNKSLNELREELKTRQTTEDLMDRISALSNRRDDPPSQNTNQGNQGQQQEATGLKAEDVERMFSERENAARQTNNLNAAQQKLVERYGDNTAAQIAAKAQELGVSRDYLRDLAKNTPTVFLAMFTDPATPKDVFNAPATGQRPTYGSGPTIDGVKKFSEYQKMRRENPTEYYGAKVQKEILAIGDRLGGPGSPRYDAWRNS